MSYLCGDLYTWGSDTHIYFSGPGASMPWVVFDAVALMRVAQLLSLPEERDALAAARALIDDRGRGNFGSWSYLKMMDETPEANYFEFMQSVLKERDAQLATTHNESDIS